MDILFKKSDSKKINYVVVYHREHINIYIYSDPKELKRYKYKPNDKYNINTKWNFTRIKELIKEKSLEYKNKNTYSIVGKFKGKKKKYYWRIQDEKIGQFRVDDLVYVISNNKIRVVKVVGIVPTMNLKIMPENFVVNKYEKA